MKKIKVIVTGASGRMGTQIAKRIVQNKSFTLFGATESVGHPSIEAVSYTHLTLPTILRV